MLHLKKQNNNKNCMCWITGKCCCLVLRFCLLVFTVRRFMLIWTHWLPKRSTAPQPRRISVWRDLCLINLKQHVYVELQTLCVFVSVLNLPKQQQSDFKTTKKNFHTFISSSLSCLYFGYVKYTVAVRSRIPKIISTSSASPIKAWKSFWHFTGLIFYRFMTTKLTRPSHSGVKTASGYR